LKVAIFAGPKRVKILDIKKPIITEDEVLIKSKVAGICGSDLHHYVGSKRKVLNLLQRAKTLFFPHSTIIGHEFSGLVAEKGKNVTNVELNERVTALPSTSCHECKYCEKGLMRLCENFRMIPGTFSEFVKVPAESILKIPDQLSYEEAAMIEPLACALHGIRLANIEKHHSVAVIGAGTIGLLVLLGVKALGVKQATIYDIVPFKLNLAKKLGADFAINSKIKPSGKEGLTQEIDIVIECVGGSGGTLNQASNIVKKRGKIVTFGTFVSTKQFNFDKFRSREITLLGSEGCEKQDFVDAINLLSSGKVDVKPLITHTFPLRNITEAFEAALKPESIKVQITE